MKKTCLLFLTAALLCAALSACGADVVPATAPPATLPPAATAAPETADNPAGETGAEPETPSETLPTDEPAAPSAEPTTEPTPEVTPEPTPEPAIPREQLDYTAAELTPMISLSVGSAGMDLSLMLDRNYETMVPFYGANMLRMDFESECSGVYVVWNTPPGEWKLWDRGETLLCGGNGFLHEYIELPVHTTMIEMILPQGGTICDFYAVGNGRLPAFIQNWQPPAEKADLLLFPTHGDDELLFFGGAMPYYAGELGMEVQVAYMTNHSNEMPRPHEQLDGLWTVGITRYPVLSDAIDKMTHTLGEAEAIYGNTFKDFQVMIIRRFQPLVVVGHDVDGEYGHGSHRLAGLALLESVPLAADPNYQPESVEWYGVWDTPKLYLHMYTQNTMEMNWDIPLSRFDGLTAFQVAQLGYLEHKSQQHWAFHVYPREEYLSCYRFGLARTTVGPDVEKNDFFENIPPRDQLP